MTSAGHGSTGIRRAIRWSTPSSHGSRSSWRRGRRSGHGDRGPHRLDRSQPCSRTESGTYVPICRQIVLSTADEPGEVAKWDFWFPRSHRVPRSPSPPRWRQGLPRMRECHRPRSFPLDSLRINAAWCVAATIAADLLAWSRLLCLDRSLAQAETKTLHYRNLHTAVRIVRGQHRRKINPADLPSARELEAAFRAAFALAPTGPAERHFRSSGSFAPRGLAILAGRFNGASSDLGARACRSRRGSARR